VRRQMTGVALPISRRALIIALRRKT